MWGCGAGCGAALWGRREAALWGRAMRLYCGAALWGSATGPPWGSAMGQRYGAAVGQRPPWGRATGIPPVLSSGGAEFTTGRTRPRDPHPWGSCGAAAAPWLGEDVGRMWGRDGADVGQGRGGCGAGMGRM